MTPKEIAAFISKIMKHNDWVNGNELIRDGDPFGAIELQDMLGRAYEAKTPEQLFEWCHKYVGTFIYNNIVILNHPNYFGTYVYIYPVAETFSEHLTVDAMDITYFRNILREIGGNIP